ncbi:topology modulation protein [Metabacillus idriensis]|uniref:topology modulation protein n=1 Tax=Metabacillus idriensis TaxID=324768 RepID=UPI0008A93EE0|nr:topology modulation protein [Metabacillus idriensis]MCM3596189.1 topology modulation protein [Metabacillus idriensis]OHR66033.1 topology modulation protein [Bacillus sp. HMSC76G11]
MNRIMVMGVSAGAGKSTFARKLGELLNINVHHLDVLYWKPNWVEAPLEEFTADQQKIVAQNQWIIEGNYHNTYDIRVQNADTIIYLELPLIVCLYRVFKRWILNVGKTRPDMGKDCKEKLDWAFIKFICTTYYPRKKKMEARFQTFKETDSKKKVIVLKNKKEICSYLETLSLKGRES